MSRKEAALPPELSPEASAYRANLRITPPDVLLMFVEIGRITPEDRVALQTTGSRVHETIGTVAMMYQEQQLSDVASYA